MLKTLTSRKSSSSRDTTHDERNDDNASLYGKVNSLASADSDDIRPSDANHAQQSSIPTIHVDSTGSESLAHSISQSTAMASGLTVKAPTGDSSVSKVYQHWADGDATHGTTAEWNNNILSDGKSDYFEGEVVPHVFYYKASNNAPLVNGHTYTFNVTYNYYQGNTNAGGFVYMTSPNIDRHPSNFTSSTAQPDSTFANHGGTQGDFNTVNANITDVSKVTYNGNSSSSIDAEVTITFVYTGPTTSSGGAEIQYGLRIAAPGDIPDQGKGETHGANSWTGGSLQTTVDIGGSGATSIQLAPSAIIVGEISGSKYNDMDGNGIWNPVGADNIQGTADDEVGLTNWKIFIDKNNDGQWEDGETFTTTDASGHYSFSVVPDADRTTMSNDAYIIREVQQDGWVRTTANPAPILITAIDPKEMHVDFGNMQLKPSLSIVKDASVPGGTADYAGEVISYTISVHNTGNQTLTGVTVTDPFISNLTLVEDPASADGKLDVNETWNYTASHIVTQAEIDAGTNIVNVATADSDQTGPSSDDASVPVTQLPALAIDKAIVGVNSGNGNGVLDAANDVVSYSVTVTNTGNLTLHNVTVNDPLTGLNVSGVTLEPGSSETYLTSYTLQQTDLDSNGGGDGFIENTATATSLEAGPASDTEEIALFPSKTLAIDKKLINITNGNGNDVADAVGDLLNYSVTVSNLGTLTLTHVTVVDPSSGLNVSGLTLNPGQSETYLTSYALTQTDLDNNGYGDGYIDNTATATSDQTAAASDSESTPLLRTVGLGVNKSVTSISGGNMFADNAGEVITYAIKVYNAGTVTLTGVSVTDELTGMHETLASLAPGQTVNYTTHYTLLQADLDNNGGGDGAIQNVTVADSDQTAPVSDGETVQLLARPLLFMNKTFVNVTSGNGNNLVDAVGDQLHYEIIVANPGNVTLTDVNVHEAMTGLDVSGVTLTPNGVLTYQTTYTLTQADLDNNGLGDGYIDNVAYASSAQTAQVSDAESVPLLRTLALSFDKSMTGVTGGNGNDLADYAGDVLNFSETVKNVGSVTLTNVVVTDQNTGLSQTVASLAPGASQTFLSSYVLLQSDLDTNGGGNGRVENTATAQSNETGPVSDTESAAIIYAPKIDLTKYVSVDQGTTWDDANVATGPTLTAAAGINPLFKYTALNNGTVTLKDVTLTDAAFDLNGADPGTAVHWGDLAPGQLAEFIYEAPFTLGQNSGDAVVTATTLIPVTDIDNAYYLGV